MLNPLKSVYFSATLPGPLADVRAVTEVNPDHPFTAAYDDANNCVVLIPKQKPGRPSRGRWRIPLHMIAAMQYAAKSKMGEPDGED